MLIGFVVENWMSFRDQATFSMVASRERQHNQRIPQLKKYKTKILPVAAIYGGNASGKTNFFQALNFVKGFVIKSTQPESLIPIEPFRLDSTGVDRPVFFAIELLVDETIYEFSFKVTRRKVLEEKLVKLTSTSEKTLYYRHDEKIDFDAPLKRNKSLHFAFRGTRDNQLFLTNSVSQKNDDFRPVYDWFKKSLEMIAPDTRFDPFEEFLDEENELYATMNEMLPQLDTGISHMGGEDVPFDNIPLPEVVKADLLKDMQEGTTVRCEVGRERYIISRKEEKLYAKKLVTYHQKNDGTEAKFDIRHESDGSQRIIDLLPAFLEISSAKSKKVFVIDEIDRSLHTLLTKQLLVRYLSNCSAESRTQLLFTTHDVMLMNQDLLRRDEMWIAERDKSGASSLVSFCEYKDVRNDKDLRKSYLQGRLGGIPRFLVTSSSKIFCQ